MICDNCKKEHKDPGLERIYVQLVRGNKVARLDFCRLCAEKALGKAVRHRYGEGAEI